MSSSGNKITSAVIPENSCAEVRWEEERGVERERERERDPSNKAQPK